MIKLKHFVKAIRKLRGKLLCWLGWHDPKIHIHRTGWTRGRCSRCGKTIYIKYKGMI